MAFPELHFFAGNAVNGSKLLEVPVTERYVERVSARIALRELGRLEFRFSRQVAEDIITDGAFKPETFVRLLVPSISTTKYIWGAFLGEQVRQLIAQIAAGEDISVGGDGPAKYLDRAILWDEQFSVDGSHPYRIDLPNGVFRFEDDADAGNVLNRLQREDSNNTIAEFIPDMTTTFDQSQDSNGDPWASPIGTATEPFELPIGQSFLEDTFAVFDAVPDLDMTWDLGTVSSPKLEMSVWQGLVGYGRDLVPSGVSDFSSGKVHFKKGVNIANDVQFVTAGRRKATHALASGGDGKYGRAVRVSYSPGDYAYAVGIDRSNLHWEPALERAAARYLAHQELGENEITLVHFPGFAPTSGRYMPGPDGTNGHYWIGDTIGLTTAVSSPTPIDLTAAPELVTAITMEMATVVKDADATEGALSWIVAAELNIERASASAPQLGGAVSGEFRDRFFVDDSAGQDQYRMRARDYSGITGNAEDYYRTIAAAKGDDVNQDAYIDLRAGPSDYSQINLFVFDNDESVYSGTFYDRGDIVSLASNLWEADVDGVDDASKHYLIGGWGLVLPILSADPAGSASEIGQEYYNDSDNVIRWYNGTIWQDVGTGTGTGGFTPVIGYAECNTSPTSGSPPFAIPWDTFYDVNQSAGSLPAGLDLSYSAGVFTASEDGIWVLNLGVNVVAAPGSTGSLVLAVPNYGYSPQLNVAASGNAAVWHIERTVVMKSGDTFRLNQNSAASTALINGYAALDIMRIADTVS